MANDVEVLRGRVALVTGAGEGAARAVALALGAAGASVVVNDVNPDRAERVAAAIAAEGGQAFPWVADVGNKFQVGSMIERLRDEYGGLHIVVSGWAVNKRSPFLTLDEYDWRRVLEVNLTGAFFVSQMAARVMADEGGGVIVQLAAPIDSTVTGQTPYAVSQAGLLALTQAMVAELAPLGVRCEAVLLRDDPAQTAAAVMQAVQGVSGGKLCPG